MEQIQMVQVEDLHPHEKNPRIDAATVADLVESIKEHGIEMPLIAAPQSTGDGYVVLAGHRRLTAAHELGLTEVPVQVRADLTDARAQLALMATENVHRDQLTAVEESRLVQDMLDLGMTQAQVAKQTALGKQRVAERVKLGKLAGDTGEKVHRGQITVDDALVIAEYSDDPEVATELEEAAGTYNFDWAVSRAKQRRETEKRFDESRKRAKKEGLRIVDEDADFVGFEELVHDLGWTTPKIQEGGLTPDTEEGVALYRAEHAACPGHSVRLIQHGPYRGDLELGCDQVATQHADVPGHHADPGEEPEPEHDPWDDITAEDFAAARIHREQHLAKALPRLDALDDAMDLAARQVLAMGWHQYYDDEHGIALLEALTGATGKAKVLKTLRTWPLHVLVWISAHDHAIKMHHRMMAEGRPGSTYWAKDGTLRQLLDRTGYAWSAPEQQAILLATGIPHDADPDAPSTDEDGAALAEGGEAA